MEVPMKFSSSPRGSVILATKAPTVRNGKAARGCPPHTRILERRPFLASENATAYCQADEKRGEAQRNPEQNDEENKHGIATLAKGS